MTEADLHSQNSAYNWQMLTEFSIPRDPGLESQVLADVTRTLQELDLEHAQLGIILTAVSQALQSVEGSLMPLHVRISVSGLPLEIKPPAGHLNQEQNLANESSGLGFFLVKRVIGQFPQRKSEEYRLLEVLIYRE